MLLEFIKFTITLELTDERGQIIMKSKGTMDCDTDVCKLEETDSSQKEFHCSLDGPEIKDFYTILVLLPNYILDKIIEQKSDYKEFALIATQLSSVRDSVNISQSKRQKAVQEIANNYNNNYKDEKQIFISNTVTNMDIFRNRSDLKEYGEEKSMYLTCIPILKHKDMMEHLIAKCTRYLQLDFLQGLY